MGNQYSGLRTASFAAANCQMIINEAREDLKKLEIPGQSRIRSPAELNSLLKALGDLLDPLLVPIPASSITDGEGPSGLLLQPIDGPNSPKGPAWAVAIALVNDIDVFSSFIEKHGQIATYLAALALSDPDSDDHSMIIGLNLCVASLKKQYVSEVRAGIASRPRSPFRALVLRVLKNHPEDTAEQIWTKMQGLHGQDLQLEFNGKQVTVDMDFFILGNNAKDRMKKSYVEWNIDADEPTTFMRGSLDRMISELRTKYAIPK